MWFLCGWVTARECTCLCYLVVISRTEEDVVSSRVPLDEAHSAAVTLELLPWNCKVLKHTVRRDLPHFDLQTHTWTGAAFTQALLPLHNNSEENVGLSTYMI